MYHTPVMLTESINALNVREGGVYVDATFGGGGHSAEILRGLGKGRLIAFDQDEDALANHPGDERLELVHQNFRYLKNFLRMYECLPVDGILADLGISSYQIDEGSKGFSTRFDAPLDMRMDRRRVQTAADVVNSYDEDGLRSMFRKYADLSNAHRLAVNLIEARQQKPILTTGHLREICQKLAPRHQENKFLAQVFQALRIEVNEEMSVLGEFLEQTIECLKPGGRLVIMSYHSLEDRMVKNFLRSGNLEGDIKKDFFGNVLTPFTLITRKAISASDEEMENNPRSRSAHLRVAERREL
ncbi:MAG: 16S rRNA (cytosine(1402)-N(4))-methyltransferase RsmH [Bacteroidales bacterium]|nr:16S rRNA (cytosine(1402)-N(4))-methyltransferase RsmH [Bacteroidales bacterium]